jgi:5-formyltetrahydrofolate cyclo-ligase
MISAAAHEKRALRAEVRERRQTMTAKEREMATAGITSNLVDITLRLSARSVACFLSTPDEPNTRPYLAWAREHDVRILYPVSRVDGLLDWTLGEDEAETLGAFGITEMSGRLLGSTAVREADLMLAPAAAVDGHGTRMGWGRGYVDKTLGSVGKYFPVYAVVFDTEVLDSLPSERHDYPVDGVITPTKVLTFTS